MGRRLSAAQVKRRLEKTSREGFIDSTTTHAFQFVTYLSPVAKSSRFRKLKRQMLGAVLKFELSGQHDQDILARNMPTKDALPLQCIPLEVASYESSSEMMLGLVAIASCFPRSMRST